MLSANICGFSESPRRPFSVCMQQSAIKPFFPSCKRTDRLQSRPGRSLKNRQGDKHNLRKTKRGGQIKTPVVSLQPLWLRPNTGTTTHHTNSSLHIRLFCGPRETDERRELRGRTGGGSGAAKADGEICIARQHISSCLQTSVCIVCAWEPRRGHRPATATENFAFAAISVTPWFDHTYHQTMHNTTATPIVILHVYILHTCTHTCKLGAPIL